MLIRAIRETLNAMRSLLHRPVIRSDKALMKRLHWT